MRDDIDHTANDAVGQVVIVAVTTIRMVLVILGYQAGRGQVDYHCHHDGGADEECLHGYLAWSLAWSYVDASDIVEDASNADLERLEMTSMTCSNVAIYSHAEVYWNLPRGAADTLLQWYRSLLQVCQRLLHDAAESTVLQVRHQDPATPSYVRPAWHVTVRQYLLQSVTADDITAVRSVQDPAVPTELQSASYVICIAQEIMNNIVIVRNFKHYVIL